MYNNFKEDLRFGNEGEDIVAKTLEKYYKVKVTKNNSTDVEELKGYDLLIDNKIKVEVKRDLNAGMTNALAIEVSYKRRPSGIMTSKALLWAFLVRKRIYIYKLSDLIKEYKNKTYDVILDGGDYKMSKLAIFELDYLKTLPHKILFC